MKNIFKIKTKAHYNKKIPNVYEELKDSDFNFDTPVIISRNSVYVETDGKRLFRCQYSQRESNFHLFQKLALNGQKEGFWAKLKWNQEIILKIWNKEYWLLKNENIMWVINITVAVMAIIATIKN